MESEEQRAAKRLLEAKLAELSLELAKAQELLSQVQKKKRSVDQREIQALQRTGTRKKPKHRAHAPVYVLSLVGKDGEMIGGEMPEDPAEIPTYESVELDELQLRANRWFGMTRAERDYQDALTDRKLDEMVEYWIRAGARQIHVMRVRVNVHSQRIIEPVLTYRSGLLERFYERPMKRKGRNQ